MRKLPISIRLVRIVAGISMTEISDRTGINLPRLSRIERAIIPPTKEEAYKILAALGGQVEARRLRGSNRAAVKAPDPEAA